MTLVELYLTVNFAVRQKLLQDCTTVNSFSVLQQFTVKTSEYNSVCTVRALERYTVIKLYRSAKTVSGRTKLLLRKKNCRARFFRGLQYFCLTPQGKNIAEEVQGKFLEFFGYFGAKFLRYPWDTLQVCWTFWKYNIKLLKKESKIFLEIYSTMLLAIKSK